MSKKDKKDKKEKDCGCSNQHSNSSALPHVKVIPVRDIPDNCQLICVGSNCTIVCFGADLRVIHCDIICDDAGNCTVNCMPAENQVQVPDNQQNPPNE